jgi:acetyltransferase
MLGGGGYSVQTADLCSKEGLELPILSEETQKELKSFIAVTGAGFKNPLDSEPMAEHSEAIFRALKTLIADPSIDTVIMSTELGFLRGAEKVKELTDNLTQFAKDNPYKKPIAAIMDSAMARGDDMIAAVSALKKALPMAAIPLYRTMARLIRAVSKATQYYRFCAETKDE